MIEYLASCRLQGHCPKGIAWECHRPRCDLVSKLIRKRQVARFVVAPKGSGKTFLVLEYAQTVFQFNDTFVLDAQDPRFIVALDEGTLAPCLLSMQAAKTLLIVEDVPILDQVRAQRFSEEITLLLEHKIEVLVTCSPLSDAFGSMANRICLTVKDLLVKDSEFVLQDVSVQGQREVFPRFDATGRLPIFVWGSQHERNGFLARVLCEEMPCALIITLFVLLAIQKGPIGNTFQKASVETHWLSHVAEHYPFLGVEIQNDRFKALNFQAENVAEAFERHLEVAARRDPDLDINTLLCSLADILLEQGDPERACGLLRKLAGARDCLSWVDARRARFFKHACIFPVFSVCKEFPGRYGLEEASVFRLRAYQAMRLALLRDGNASKRLFEGLLNNRRAPVPVRIFASLVLHVLFSAKKKTLSDICRMSGEKNADRFEGRALIKDKGFEEFASCALVALAYESSFREGVEKWEELFAKGEESIPFKFTALLFFNKVFPEEAQGDAKKNERKELGDRKARGMTGERGAAKTSDCSVEEIPRCFARMLFALAFSLNNKEVARIDIFDALIVLAIERYRDEYVELNALLASDGYRRFSLQALHLSLLEQQKAYADAAKQENERLRDFIISHPDMYSSRAHKEAKRLGAMGNEMKTSAPLLTVNLFGGFRAFMGDAPIDPSLFRREKEKRLLTLLVLHRGKEFPRESLSALLWPESESNCARSNLYDLCSRLRKVLRAPSGECPYIISQRCSLKINADLLESDVLRFERLCKKLDYGCQDRVEWEDVLVQLDGHFSEELLPGEQNDPYVAGVRNGFRKRLVDSLVSASARLQAAGDSYLSMRLAKEALKRDDIREDAYLILMKAQVACGQRIVAMETFTTCRHILLERLGMSPSRELENLYCSILEERESEPGSAMA